MDGQARMLFFPPGVRKATRADVFHMISVARESYPEWQCDWGSVSAWLSQNTENPDIFACVARGAATISMFHEWFWGGPKCRDVTVLFLAGPRHPWGVVGCLRATVEWAKSRGAHTLKMDAATGIDLAPLVVRLGFPVQHTAAYSVRLR